MSGGLRQVALHQISVIAGRYFMLEASTSALAGLPQHPARSSWGAATVCSRTSCRCPCCQSCNRAYTSSSSNNSSSASISTSHRPSSSNEGSNPSSTPSSSSSSSKHAGSTGTHGGRAAAPSQSRRALLEEIKAVRAHVFEQHIGDGRRSGRKAILRAMKGRYIADWYFTLTGPKMPMTSDEVDEERQLKVELARATGGGPPKKGQGKRGKK